MSYTPPNTLVASTVLEAADVEGNFDELRVYLHGAIPAGDVEAAKWINSRHIQPPTYSPFEGVQHGVTGHQGGQWSGGPSVRLSFLTKYLTGQGAQNPKIPTGWQPIPGTSFSVYLRRPAFCLFHYWYEIESGPDVSTGADQVAVDDRQSWITPYVTGLDQIATTFYPHAQEAQQHQGDLVADPIGAARPFTLEAGYGQRDGVLIATNSAEGSETLPRGMGGFEAGLAGYSQVDRVVLVNWSVVIETFYL
jgi:hypothetical protein